MNIEENKRVYILQISMLINPLIHKNTHQRYDFTGGEDKVRLSHLAYNQNC